MSPKKSPPPAHLPELRADHELMDNPTMHADHELPGMQPEQHLLSGRKTYPFIRALATGTFITIIAWIVLAFTTQALSQIVLYLLILPVVWVVAIAVVYINLKK